MTAKYTQTLSTDMIVSEIEALMDWRTQVFRAFFFPGSQVRPVDVYAPGALLMWCRKGLETGAIGHAAVDKLALVHDELCRAARRMADHAATGAAADLEMYDSFENQYAAYITHIRRLHQDMSDAGMAVDVVTGLRTVSGMRGDFKREQDRFDRKGASFSVASIEIDKIGEWQQKLDRQGIDALYRGVAQVVARMIRSFDDAYFLGKGEFLLLLKHVEFNDACTVMDRLRAEIEKVPVVLAGGDKIKVTVSLGICEAMQRDDPENAIYHAKSAMSLAKDAGGNRVNQYLETSTLQQYVKDVGSFGK
jgi:diguanylate cyclase (GGDEF)-like protein